MENRFLKTWVEGCARNLAFQIIVMGAAFGLFLIPALIAALWGGDRDTNFAIFMGILIFIIVAGVVGIVTLGVSSIRKRAAQLDAVFEPWRLTGDPYLQNGRQYHGDINGRQVDIYFHRGPTLEIHIAAPLHTRAAVVFKSEIGRISASLGDCETVALNDPVFHNLSSYALDANWMNKILADGPARVAIRQLMRVTGAYELRQILIQPDALKLTIRRVGMEQINRQNVGTWLDDLFTLLMAIVEAPDPQAITVAMPIERAVQSDRGSLAILVAAAGCSIIATLSFYILVITAVIRLFSSLLN